MKHILIIVLSFVSLSVFGQIVRVDSTVIHESRSIYNSAGYYIGKDSFHVKRVRLAYCNDTFYERNDTLILRSPQRFITMDSVTGSSCPECGVPLDDLKDTLDYYLMRSDNDTIFGQLNIVDKPGFPFATYPLIHMESGSAPYIIDLETNGGVTVYKLGASGVLRFQNDQMQIDRQGEYTPTDANDVLVQSEIKDLISDSIATRPTLTTVRNEISDSLATVSAPDLSGYIKSNANDTVLTYYTLWKNGTDEFKITNNQSIITDGTNNITTNASSVNIADGGDNSFYQTFNNAYLYNDSDASKLDMYSNHLTIDRAGYSATGSTEVPIVSEVKALINDSLDTRLAGYTPNTDLEEKIQDQIGLKLVEGTNVTLTYNDATGETTIDASGGGGGGLTDEQVRDTTVAMFTVGPSITWNEDDANDSIYLDVSTNPLETAVQRTLLGKNFSAWVSGAGGAPSLGIAITTVPGVANTGTVSSTSPYLRRPMKTEYRQTTATTSNVAQIRSQRTICRGTEGYIYTITWAPVAGLSNANDRAFAGLKVASGDVSDVNPNTLTTVIGMGYNDATDSNFKIYHNDGSGTATEVDLGSSFPIPTTNETDFYTLILYVPNPGTTIYYKVIDEKDGTSVTGSVNSNIPDPATFLTAYAYTSVGGTSSVTTLGLFSIYSMVLDNY